MAAFRNCNVSVGGCSQGVGAGLRKSGVHIPNFVAGLASILLMFHPLENKSVICFVEVLLLESNLLGSCSGRLNSDGQVYVFR
jgi:hypothetical protein